MGRMIAAILAGGKGTRMDVLCQVRPKPVLPFAGKYRLIDFPMSNCVHSQITDMALFVDYQRSQLSQYAKTWQGVNASKSRIDILEPQNNGFYSGSANALYQHLNYLRHHPADRVLVMPSDHAYKMDYRKMLAFHDSAGADITVSVIPVPMEEAHRFGTLVLENNGYVSEYMEKPDAPKSNLASMGIYIFNKDVLLDRLTEDARQADSVHDFGYSIIPPMVGNDKVFAYKYEDFWRDIGTIESYYNTSMELVGGKLPFALNGKWPVLTCENSSAGKTNKNVNIVNSVIGPGCIIKGKVNNSILSAGVKIDEQTVVNNSIVYSNVIIGAHSLIDASIIDENVTVGDFSYVGFGKNQNKIADCTILGKGCTIASHTAIAHSCKIAPYTSPTKSISKERVTTNHGEGIPFLVSQQRNQAIISS